MDSSEVRYLKQQRAKLKSELAKMSMEEHYTEYVKLERKIFKLDTEIQNLQEGDVFKTFLLKYGINYGFKFIVGFALFLVTILNRNHAVIVFSEKFDFSPFSGIISYPSNIDNAVSLPFWLLVNNYVFRQISTQLSK